MSQLSRQDVLGVLREFALIGGTSVQLAAWELDVPDVEVASIWRQLLEQQRIVEVEPERGEAMFQLTAAGAAELESPGPDRSTRVFTAMIRLVYASRATAPMDDAALAELLTHSRARNESAQVTGLLVYARESFMQVLEGTPASVAAIFRSIDRDPRHTDLRIHSHQPIGRRRYPDWSMGFRALDAEALAAQLPGYQWPLRSPLIQVVPSEGPEIADVLLEQLAPPA